MKSKFPLLDLVWCTVGSVRVLIDWSSSVQCRCNFTLKICGRLVLLFKARRVLHSNKSAPYHSLAFCSMIFFPLPSHVCPFAQLPGKFYNRTFLRFAAAYLQYNIRVSTGQLKSICRLGPLLNSFLLTSKTVILEMFRFGINYHCGKNISPAFVLSWRCWVLPAKLSVQ